ncbi:MAG: AMIN-like domain-containing (lipo)protein [Candidatus Limnocylindria bacterium]
MRRPVALALVIATALLAGCVDAVATPSVDAPAPSATPTSTPSVPGSAPESTAATPTASVEPIPSADLGSFSCDLPIVEDATVPLANITDVRIGSHADYDRVVFEFADGLPEITLDRASPPFTQDASGMPIEVSGSSFLRLTMRGGTKQTVDNTSSYDGPTDFDPAFATLVDLVEGGDFEAQSTWYLGLTGEACVRVMQLVGEGGSPRLVIDVQG